MKLWRMFEKTPLALAVLLWFVILCLNKCNITIDCCATPRSILLQVHNRNGVLIPYVSSGFLRKTHSVIPNLRLCHAVISQITTTMVAQMEEPGHQAAHQVALQPAQLKDQLRAPMVHITRMMEATLPRLPPNPPKRSPLCTREGSHHFQVL